jgi:hypothetical protein
VATRAAQARDPILANVHGSHIVGAAVIVMSSLRDKLAQASEALLDKFAHLSRVFLTFLLAMGRSQCFSCGCPQYVTSSQGKAAARGWPARLAAVQKCCPDTGFACLQVIQELHRHRSWCI